MNLDTIITQGMPLVLVAISMTEVVRSMFGSLLSPSARNIVLPVVALAFLSFFVQDPLVLTILWVTSQGAVLGAHRVVDRVTPPAVQPPALAETPPVVYTDTKPTETASIPAQVTPTPKTIEY